MLYFPPNFICWIKISQYFYKHLIILHFFNSLLQNCIQKFTKKTIKLQKSHYQIHRTHKMQHLTITLFHFSSSNFKKPQPNIQKRAFAPTNNSISFPHEWTLAKEDPSIFVVFCAWRTFRLFNFGSAFFCRFEKKNELDYLISFFRFWQVSCFSYCVLLLEVPLFLTKINFFIAKYIV